MINIAIADDNIMYGRGLMNAIHEKIRNVKVYNISINGDEVLEYLKQNIKKIDILLLDLKMPKCNGTEETLQNVINEIKKLNEDFKIEDYKVDVYKLKENADYYSITFTYKEGEFLTNSEYVVAVEDGKVKQITDNTIKNSSMMLMSNQVVTDKEIEQAKMEATNKIERYKNNKEIKSVEIKEQKNELYLDKSTNKKYIKVLTKYGFNESSGSNGEEYLYQIK